MVEIEKIHNAINKRNIEWKSHSLKRMLERGISRKDILNIIINGEIIEDYPDDKPFGSFLFLGFIDKEPLHAVISYDEENKKVSIITAYKPDTVVFEDNYKTRRKQ